MYCPLLIHDEEFCLLDNCRYYDTETQDCLYTGSGSIKKEPEYDRSQKPVSVREPEKTAVIDVSEEDPVYSPRPGKKDVSYGKNEEKVLHEEPKKTVVSFDEEEEHVPSPRTETENKMSAKQIWDRLRDFNETEGIPDYDELVGSLIKVVNNTEDIHYLTSKSAEFWYSRVSGLDRYNKMVEKIPQ
ncbi:MAG TPA: hypothetical protein VMZ05_04905 [Spirochaetota bacterium]|nr:hypothetical protein [Spirochaetota bacterium]